jgi:hypothetical protein
MRTAFAVIRKAEGLMPDPICTVDNLMSFANGCLLIFETYEEAREAQRKHGNLARVYVRMVQIYE